MIQSAYTYLLNNHIKDLFKTMDRINDEINKIKKSKQLSQTNQDLLTLLTTRLNAFEIEYNSLNYLLSLYVDMDIENSQLEKLNYIYKGE